MVVKAERRRATQNLVCRDLIPMAKAKLPELQSYPEPTNPTGNVDETRACRNRAMADGSVRDCHQRIGMAIHQSMARGVAKDAN